MEKARGVVESRRTFLSDEPQWWSCDIKTLYEIDREGCKEQVKECLETLMWG